MTHRCKLHRESGFAGVAYTGQSRLGGVAYTGESRLPGVAYTGEFFKEIFFCIVPCVGHTDDLYSPV